MGSLWRPETGNGAWKASGTQGWLLVLVLLRGFFSGFSSSPSSTKTNILKFPLDQDIGPAWKPAVVASSINIDCEPSLLFVQLATRVRERLAPSVTRVYILARFVRQTKQKERLLVVYYKYCHHRLYWAWPRVHQLTHDYWFLFPSLILNVLYFVWLLNNFFTRWRLNTSVKTWLGRGESLNLVASCFTALPLFFLTFVFCLSLIDVPILPAD